ncbi:glyoxalase/bleomycin resistance/extradiol dioxygenase family protein [Chitinophaga horti]|uniref:Glyoxalase/bleomycin resistance/extradiol dioxygenase family protein n=1 Tax=Chitinophaga horti TaxID=2920382 RepID=A0ABY6J8A8_9BACT|nr:glyoxalase/bleomycin resistance/extradiol dioxygenase family protein [Chitinophaga horti]UYQ95928.1 glyoxalase/bleomycin resistance/extradiol dioxygenase family protein [Chitinophaga horti]
MKQIFINLPVADVVASMEFYTKIGFEVNPLFTFDDQKCMAWGENVFVMLQKRKGPVVAESPVTFTLPVERMEELNKIVQRALDAGGTEPTPGFEEPFMVVREIGDLDGHRWGIVCIDGEV